MKSNCLPPPPPPLYSCISAHQCSTLSISMLKHCGCGRGGGVFVCVRASQYPSSTLLRIILTAAAKASGCLFTLLSPSSHHSTCICHAVLGGRVEKNARLIRKPEHKTFQVITLSDVQALLSLNASLASSWPVIFFHHDLRCVKTQLRRWKHPSLSEPRPPRDQLLDVRSD